VSKPSEDICNLCVAFANRHKYRLPDESAENSSADAELFTQPPPLLTEYDSDDSEDEEEDTSGEPKEKSTVAGEEAVEESPVDRLLNDKDAVADDPAVERREQMIGRAYKHVEMARAQRLLYTNLINKARRDAIDSIQHSKRSYTFVVDYGQNMEVPVLNNAQFGASYYMSPLSIYNLGMVDQAHVQEDGQVKDLMYCHVYHEGVGSKGGNNVCSLIHKTLEMMGLLQENDSV
jgi:hypothetical protein